VKDISKYLGIFCLLKLIFQNELIIQRTCVEMAKVLWYVGLLGPLTPLLLTPTPPQQKPHCIQVVLYSNLEKLR
jgi:hypothetical protein